MTSRSVVCVGICAASLALSGCGNPSGEVDDLAVPVDLAVAIDSAAPLDALPADAAVADAGAAGCNADLGVDDGGCGPVVPQAPTGITVTQHDGFFAVGWIAPTNTGGVPLSASAGFLISWTPNAPAQPLAVAGNATSATVNGLSVGTTYVVSVAAQNSVGASAYAAAAPTVFAAAPNAPVNVALSPGNAQIVVTWDAQSAVQAGGIAATYLATLSDGSHQTVSTNSATIGGLANGTVYGATVRAINAVGQSAATPGANAAMPWNPPGVPSAPVMPMVTQTSTNPPQVTVSWSAPAAPGNGPVTGYAVTANSANGPQSAMTSLTNAVMTLTGGFSYTFTIAAQNAVGTGPSASASPAPLPVVGPPQPPTAVTASQGNGSIAVHWNAPTNTGGVALGNYTVEACDASGNNCGNSQTAAASMYTYTTLTVGAAYTFRVAASNQYGASAFSAASSPVTFVTAPGAPTITGVSDNGSGAILVTWTAPSTNGGTAVTGYNLTATSSSGGSTGAATAASSATSATIGSLSNCHTYTVTMTASNAVGASAASAPSASIQPVGAPSTPATPSASAPSPAVGDELIVSWSAPSNNGCAIDQYRVDVYQNGTFLESLFPTSTSAAVSSLAVCPFSSRDCNNPFVYSFVVSAHNAGGWSSASGASTASRPLVSYAGDGVASIWTSSTTAWGGGSGTCTTCHATGSGNPLVLDTSSYANILNTACVVKNSGAVMGTAAYLLQCSANLSGCTYNVCPPSGTGSHPGGVRFNANTLPYDLVAQWISDGLLP